MKQLFVSIILLVISSHFLFEKASTTSTDFSDLETSVQYIRAVMQIDRVRQFNRDKVLQIINNYNPDMPMSMKEEVAEEIYEMSIKYPNLDVDLICATITHESGRTWDPGVISNAGAMGLMQIMPNTGKWLAKYERLTFTSAEEVLFNPIYNIRMGSRYLSSLIEIYDLEGGLAAYNGGEKRVVMWLANNKADGILWDETKNYIPFILKLYDEFKSFTL